MDEEDIDFLSSLHVAMGNKTDFRNYRSVITYLHVHYIEIVPHHRGCKEDDGVIQVCLFYVRSDKL